MVKDSILSKFGMKAGKGLVWVNKPTNNLSPSEILALAEARKFKADAVYFRRFPDGSRSMPQVYVYEQEFSDDDLVEIHRDLWSSGNVPFFYTVSDTQVKIFNCTKSVEIKGKARIPISKPLKVFSLLGDIQEELEQEKFSAKLFDNGTFWEEHPSLLNAKNSPYQKLLEGLLQAKKDLEKRKLPLSTSTINKLLIIGILVRYLEEKADEKGTKLLEISRDLYKEFPDCHRFTDILRQGQIIPFLNELDEKFNGKLFDLKENERQELQNAKLDFVAAIFDANIVADTRQYILWEIYSFNHLPIELISGLYEAFLKKERSVVYTPPYLVNLLIDECMPLDKAEEYFSDESFKVLDPACGSGVFLVAALKRMVQWKAYLHYKITGEVAYPEVDVIKRITKNNIYGIDIEEGATLVTVFSLCIALCDKLSPMQIWNDLRFDEELVEKNIRTTDFFKIYNDIPKGAFDLVIGNPPFNPPSPFNNKSYLKYVATNYHVQPAHPLNDDNLALFFWDRAVLLRKNGGKICFILPAGAWLYNNNSYQYRSDFLKKFQIVKIIDFTQLSDKLFHGRANIAVCSTIATDLDKMYDGNTLHIVVRRSKLAEERFNFEVDHYDFHKIAIKDIAENSLILKSNLLGGMRLFQLLKSLENFATLREYLAEMEEMRGWKYGEGYIVGHRGNLKSKEIISNGRTRKFYDNVHWITGKKSIITESVKESGEFEWFIERETLFEWPRRKTRRIFQAPHILIKANLGTERIPVIFSEEYMCFKDKIIGIHSPEKDKKLLKSLYAHLNKFSSLNRLICICSSGQAGVSMSSQVLLKTDIMNLPYPENPIDLNLSNNEIIIQNDVLDYYIKSNASSETSPLSQPVQGNELKEYGEVFCKTLNPIYEKGRQKWFVHGYHEAEQAIAFAFCYGLPKLGILSNMFDDGLDGIERLLQNETRRNFRITRVLREYLHIEGYDVLIFIKPKTVRYWLKSIALRDADETFSDLKRTGF
ncbi:MAG: N-6 DNA methylase [Lewinella sp.]|nr:N-6 DNA methylase [Lewinella sp.]